MVAIRDVAEIRAKAFPFYARGVTHRGPYKDGLLAIPQVNDMQALIDNARAVLVAKATTIQAMKEGRWDRPFIDAVEARCNN